MMRSLWDEGEAARFPGELEQRVYSSRLLGRDRSLVLHGGGNTSVKVRERNLLGEEEDLLYVKGSGWDLETIEAAGFTPLRLTPLLDIARLPALSDPEMVNALLCQRTRASAPSPSVETLLHAALPHKYVDHTHADAVVTVTNTPGGERRVAEIWGESVVIVPYVMPGFDLARLAAQLFASSSHAGTLGMVLLHHGIFSFGASAREAYERMIHLVGLAEDYLARHGAWVLDGSSGGSHGQPDLPLPPFAGLPRLALDTALLRSQISAAAGFPLILTSRRTARTLGFAGRPDVAELSQHGPATPDHVLRTRRLPLVMERERPERQDAIAHGVAAYVAAYRAYFERHAAAAREPKTMLDPAPRVVLDPELGLLAAGRSRREAAIAAEIYEHTMDILERASLLGGYRALPAGDLFDVEYWDLEQAKLKQAGAPRALAGEAALVTGAASGIGAACVRALAARGAAVAGLDIDPRIEGPGGERGGGASGEAARPSGLALGLRCDVTQEAETVGALARVVAELGGLDMLVLNAGIFPESRAIGELPMSEWRRVMAVNLDANLTLMRQCLPLLRLAPAGGRVVIIGSKNVAAPGRGAAAYSASKAALQQLARVAALEWARDGIRVNIVHPNAVFDTAIWSPEVLASRASASGQSVEQYRHGSNLLGLEVGSQDVAEVAAELCGPRFSRTTGARIPVDGGNERVI